MKDRPRTFEVISAFNPEQAEAREAILAAFRDKKVTLRKPEQIGQLAERVRGELR